MESTKMTDQIEKRLKERGHSDPQKAASVIMTAKNDSWAELRAKRDARMLAKGNTPPGYVDGDAFVPEDVQAGDYVDFGAYGRLFVLKAPMEGKLWVTNIRADRYDSNAPGYYINRNFAKKIIEEA